MSIAPYPDSLAPGQKRWRLTLHTRLLSAAPLSTTGVTELDKAHGRHLEQKWNQPALLQFSLDGRSQAAGYIAELLTEVAAWRIRDGGGVPELMFRGIVTQTEDQISEDVHTVTVTCHDYLAMLDRRFFLATTPVTYTNLDQDTVVANLVAAAQPGGAYAATSFLPLAVHLLGPSGTVRGLSAQLRTRTYMGGTAVGTALADLAAVQGGFDYSLVPDPGGVDALNVYYPNQGITRADPMLVYGSNVSALTRSVNSADYANYVRSIGNNASADPNAAQLIGTAQTTDATSAGSGIGLWQLEDDASDVNIAQTLTEKAQGDVSIYTLTPTYTLTLRLGAYARGPNGNTFDMGDTVSVVVRSGRLNVTTAVRIVGITFDIGDDGDEKVTADVGRRRAGFADLYSNNIRSIQSLNRR